MQLKSSRNLADFQLAPVLRTEPLLFHVPIPHKVGSLCQSTRTEAEQVVRLF